MNNVMRNCYNHKRLILLFKIHYKLYVSQFKAKLGGERCNVFTRNVINAYSLLSKPFAHAALTTHGRSEALHQSTYSIISCFSKTFTTTTATPQHNPITIAAVCLLMNIKPRWFLCAVQQTTIEYSVDNLNNLLRLGETDRREQCHVISFSVYIWK